MYCWAFGVFVQQQDVYGAMRALGNLGPSLNHSMLLWVYFSYVSVRPHTCKRAGMGLLFLGFVRSINLLFSFYPLICIRTRIFSTSLPSSLSKPRPGAT